MSLSAISTQDSQAENCFRSNIFESAVCRAINKYLQFPNCGSNENTDFLHREGVMPSTVSAVAGAFSAEWNDHHQNASLQVTRPYKHSVEGACMKNGNILHSRLHIRERLKEALRRDTLRYRSAARFLAEICGKSERTAANWLSGATGMSAEDLLIAAEELDSVRDLVIKAITPPDDYTLAQELTILRQRLARAEARYREEFNVETGAPDHMAFQMDAGASPDIGPMARSQGRFVGTAPNSNPQKAGA